MKKVKGQRAKVKGRGQGSGFRGQAQPHVPGATDEGRGQYLMNRGNIANGTLEGFNIEEVTQ